MPKQTLKSIERQIAKLKAAAEKLAAKDKMPAIRQITALMTKHGVTIAEVTAASGKRKPAAKRPVKAKASPVAAKYRDPVGGTTWSGRGRMPVWMKTAIETGATRERFLITKME